MSIVDMRDFLAHKYSRNWVDKKTDEEVLRIYHNVIAREEKKLREGRSDK